MIVLQKQNLEEENNLPFFIEENSKINYNIYCGDYMKNNLDNIEFDIKWEDKPAGLWSRFLTLIHLNFTVYQITKDELIIKKGFLRQEVNTTELYLLKDPDLTVNLYQRLLGIGTVSVFVDSKSSSNRAGTRIVLKNIRNCDKVRKLLRDAIEADVMERKITYFDKV